MVDPRRGPDDEDEVEGLPPLDVDDGEGDAPVEDDGALSLGLPEGSDDPFDDVCADHLPIDVSFVDDADEPTVVGDDALGLEESTDHDVEIRESGPSLLGPDSDHEGLLFGGDEELGIDPIPLEEDDGGVEGLDDPHGSAIDTDAFPELDGSEDDDEPVDVGVHIQTDESDPPPVD